MAARLSLLLLFLLVASLPSPGAIAQQPVNVVMLSDIHFDPFHNPSQLNRLRTEPVERWPTILATPSTAEDAARLESLQTACQSRALDTAWPLLRASLLAARDAEAHPLFITLAGDLLTHDVPCRFHQLAPGTTPQDLATFAAKTVSFVLAQTRGAFPGAPVYAALGNNDSGCSDYRATPNDLFLQQVSAAFRTAARSADLTLTPEGDYSVPLPPPLDHTRLLVLENTFESRQFQTCGGTPDRSAERAQLDWLRAQLADARDHNQHVWFMSHIPPGVDVLTSFRRYVLQPAALCDATPRAFLADTALSDTLLDYADVVRLALFGHTHMDEIRVLQRPGTGSGGSDAATATIPAKLVPSITPFAGNHPAFLVAQVVPQSAKLKDWRTIISPGPQGSTPPWAEAYRFTTAYHLPDFSAASALKLADSLLSDKTGQAPESTVFRQHFYPGDLGLYALGLAQIWPAYACSVREDRPSAVHQCICGALPAPAAPSQP